jgi:hypothetical protein
MSVLWVNEGWAGIDYHLPCESNTAAMTVYVTKDARRAHLVRREEVAEIMLVHGLREVGNVEVGVLFVGECLELRVEGLLLARAVSEEVKDIKGKKLTLAKLTS